jgi:hypothetical protein
MNWPKLDFEGGNNSAISLNVLAEHARRGNVKVISKGINQFGRLALEIELPGSKTVRPPPPTSRR